MRNAQIRYARLEEESRAQGHLARVLDRQRRAEIAAFGESSRRSNTDLLLHVATFGLYNHRAPESPDNVAKLSTYRQIEQQLSFLDGLAAAGTQPEVAYNSARIESSVDELTSLMPQIDVPRVRKHAITTLKRIRDISQSAELRTDCSTAIASLTEPPVATPKLRVGGIVADAAIAPESGK
jgi:hypothetical protein